MSAWGAAHAFVCQGIARAGFPVTVLRLHAQPRPDRPGLLKRVAAHPVRSVRGRLREALLRRPLARVEQQVARALFDGPPPAPSAMGLVEHDLPTWRLRTAVGADLVASLRPEVLLSSSAPMLKPAIYTQAQRVALNLHWGMAPTYRGEHIYFWALANGDPEGIGTTLHRIDRGSDTGAIYDQTQVSVSPRATEADCWIACARAAAERVPARLMRLDEPGTPQAGAGHLYRYSDRTVTRHAWQRLRHRMGRSLRQA